MFLCPLNRESLITFLPQRGTVAEIGVAEGEFSRKILETNRPDVLHLIDPWIHQDDEDYKRDPNNVEDDKQQNRFERVKKTFHDQIQEEKVNIHRTYSWKAASSFPEQSLDWIYLDAQHTYEAVKNDLEAFKNKVKENGLLLGHDYTNHSGARKMNFGVVEAVDEFVENTNFQMFLLTMESYPTFVLTRDPEDGLARFLLSNLMMNIPMIEIEDYPEGCDFEHKYCKINGDYYTYLSF